MACAIDRASWLHAWLLESRFSHATFWAAVWRRSEEQLATVRRCDSGYLWNAAGRTLRIAKLPVVSIEQAFHGLNLMVLHVDDGARQGSHFIPRLCTRHVGSACMLEEHLGHVDRIFMVGDHLAQESLDWVAVSFDSHIVVHLAVNCDHALVEVALQLGVSAAKEVLARAGGMGIGKLLDIDCAAGLVPLGDHRRRDEETLVLGLSRCVVSSDKLNYRAHPAVYVAEVVNLGQVGPRDRQGRGEVMSCPLFLRVKEYRLVRIEAESTLVACDGLAVYEVLKLRCFDLRTFVLVAARVVGATWLVCKADGMVPVRDVKLFECVRGPNVQLKLRRDARAPVDGVESSLGGVCVPCQRDGRARRHTGQV
mmetsp:Transcript_45375/g.96535  ORF Transcript_45375/g.96535 Transcript_45375/m.96535 type:complete len:366 (+) Transcript_45375:287-1384(+)